MSDETTYVCADKDIVCGNRPVNWCASCPLRKRYEDRMAAFPEEYPSSIPGKGEAVPSEGEMLEARPLSEYHEDHGPVVWWTWERGEWLGEPSYIGRPDDSDWPGYHTHWTPHPKFPRAAVLTCAACGGSGEVAGPSLGLNVWSTTPCTECAAMSAEKGD